MGFDIFWEDVSFGWEVWVWCVSWEVEVVDIVELWVGRLGERVEERLVGKMDVVESVDD